MGLTVATAACLALLGDLAPDGPELIGYLPWALPPLGLGLLLYLRARQRARPPQRPP